MPDAGFAAAVAEWAGFWAYAGAAAATLLGLLFVAVSLRLNIFRQAVVADVEAMAAHALLTFLALVLLAGAALVPAQSRLGLGLPVAALGLAGLASLARVAGAWRRLNPGARVGTPGTALFLANGAGFAAVAGCGAALAGGQAGALYALVPAAAALLGTGTAGAWVLLSHAGGG